MPPRQGGPALAGGPSTGVPSSQPAFLALTRVTVDELLRLVLSFEAVLPAPGRAATSPSYSDAPHTMTTETFNRDKLNYLLTG